MKEDTLDWFAAVTLNPDMDYAHFSVQGYDDSNTVMLTPEKYKKYDKVQKIFTDENGKFNDNLFNQKYNEALKTYNTFISGDIQDKHFRLYSGTIYNPSAKKVVNPSLRVNMVDNPLGTSYGLVGFNQESKPFESAREIAQRNKVYDSETKSVLDYTPNDFFNSMFGVPLVEAKWDKAGKHIDSWGNEAYHDKGDWKTLEGKPYYETLGNQDSTGKEFLHWTDVVTDDGSMMNSIDFLDSDGLTKSIAGQTVKTIASVGLLFVPYLGEAIIGFGVAKGLSDIASTLTKSIEEASNNDKVNKSPIWNFANSMDGFFNRFDRSQSDESLTKPWGYENITNIIDDTFEQLKQQKWIAKSLAGTPERFAKNEAKLIDNFIAKNKDVELVNYGKTLENAVKDGDLGKTFKDLQPLFGHVDEFQALEKSTIRATKLGQELGSHYMALIQTKNVYENLKQNNFDSSTVLAGTVAASLGFIGIMKTDLGKVAYGMFEPNEVQKVLSPIVTDAIKETAEASGAIIGKDIATSAGKMKFVKNAYDKVMTNAKSLWDAKGEFGIKGYLSDMLKEGTEEVTEEFLQDAVMQGAKYYEEGIRSVTGVKSKNTYKYSESNPFDRYAMSFFGGALGGGIFKGTEHIENGKEIADLKAKRDAASTEYMSKDTMTKLVSTLATSGLERVEKEINKQLDNGILSDKLSIDVTDDSKSDNVTFKVTDDVSKSQREIVRSNLLGFVRGIDAVLSNDNLKLDEEDVVNKALVKQSLAKHISNNFTKMIYSEYLNEVSEKTKLTLQLNGTENETERTKLKQQIAIHATNIDNILSGANAGEYAEKIAFANNPDLINMFISPNVQMYAKSQFNINYNTVSETKKADIDREYNKYMKSVEENKDVVKAYKLFKTFKENFQPIVGEFVNSKFFETYKNLHEIIKPKEFEMSEDEMNENINLFKQDLTDDEFIERHGLNKESVYMSDEQKASFVRNVIIDNIKNNPQLIDIAKKGKEYNLALGSNYLLDPFSDENSNKILEDLKKYILDGGKLNKYTKDMLQSHLDSINEDLSTHKTMSNEVEKWLKLDKNSDDYKNNSELYESLKSLYQEHTGISDFDTNVFLVNKGDFNSLVEFMSDNAGTEFAGVSKLIKTKEDLNELLDDKTTLNDPIYDILSKMSTELFGYDLFKILKDEDSNFKSSKVLDEYIIRDKVINEKVLQGMLQVIDIFKAITSATHKDSDYISVINAYRKKHNNLEPYIEFTDEQSIVIRNSLNNITTQIKFLLQLSNLNDSGKINSDKKTWFEAQKHLILKVTDFISENKLSEDPQIIDILTSVANMNYDDETLSQGGFENLNTNMKLVEEFIHGWAKEQDYLDDLLFKGDNPLLKLKSGSQLNDSIKLVKNPSEIEYSDLFFKQWLLSTIVLDPKEFNNDYQTFLQTPNVNAPFFSQMINVKLITAFIKDENDYFNKFGTLNELKNTNGEVETEYAKNAIYVDAPAGSGKSTMVAPFVWNMLQKTERISWLVSNNETSLNNVSKNISNIDASLTKTKDDLFKTILNEESYKVYEQLNNLLNDDIKNFKGVKFKKLFDEITASNNIPSYILYDEAGHLSTLERDILAKFDIKLVAMGDLTQNTHVVNGERYDIDTERQLFKTPKLPSGIRFNNVNQRLANLMMLEIAEELNELKEDNGMVTSVINAKLNKLQQLVTTKSLKYYQTDNELLGQKIVDKLDLIHNDKLTPEYELLVKNLIANGKNVTYIVDDVNTNIKFETYLKSLNVDVVNSKIVQGEQFDYTIINVQFDPSLKLDEYMYNFKKFNTLATRSINGNIFVNNILPINMHTRTIEKPVDIAMSQEEIDAYKSFWLNNYFNNSDIKLQEESKIEESNKDEITIIDDFEKHTDLNNDRDKIISKTSTDAENKLRNENSEVTSLEESIASVLSTDGGYVILEDMLNTRNPYNEDKSVNWEYWVLNLMFFNSDKSSDWNKLVNQADINVKNAILENVDVDTLKDSLVHFYNNGEVYLEYNDNDGNKQSLLLQKVNIAFGESIIPFTELVVETNKLTFDKKINNENRFKSKDFENEVCASKIRISPLLYAGVIKNTPSVYAFGTYNLWGSIADLGFQYATQERSQASPIATNPIGRTLNEFINEWIQPHSMKTVDRLAGINQSYRMLKALSDYALSNSETSENHDEFLKQFQQFLLKIQETVDLSIDLELTGATVNLKEDNNKQTNILTNIFNGDSNISKLAKKLSLFTKGINPSLSHNELTYNQTLDLFTEVNARLNSKNLDNFLDGFKDILRNEDIENITSEMSNLLAIDNPKSDTLLNVNTVMSDVLTGMYLLKTNDAKEEFIKYFKTDLYFSFYRNLKVMNTIVKELQNNEYNLVREALNNLTDKKTNNNKGLFKDGIWYNYVAKEADFGIKKALKINSLYSSYKNLDSVEFDGAIIPPKVFIGLEKNQLNKPTSKNMIKEIVNTPPVKPKVITSTKQIVDIPKPTNISNLTFSDIALMPLDNLNRIDIKKLEGLKISTDEITANKNVYDFLTAKIIQNGDNFVTLQHDNGRFKLIEIKKSTINPVGVPDENGLLYKNGILQTYIVRRGFKDSNNITLNGFINNAEYAKEDKENFNLLVNEDWDSYESGLFDIDTINVNLLKDSIETKLNVIPFETKVILKSNFDELSSKEYNLEDVFIKDNILTLKGLEDIDRNQLKIISELVFINSNYDPCEG